MAFLQLDHVLTVGRGDFFPCFFSYGIDILIKLEFLRRVFFSELSPPLFSTFPPLFRHRVFSHPFNVTRRRRGPESTHLFRFDIFPDTPGRLASGPLFPRFSLGAQHQSFINKSRFQLRVPDTTPPPLGPTSGCAFFNATPGGEVDHYRTAAI